MTRILATLAALLSGTVALSGPTPQAAAAPTITVTPQIEAYYPQQVPPAATGQTTRITVVVSSSEPVPQATVTARSVDGGLAISNPTQAVGALQQPTTVSFDVAGLTPGSHALLIDAQADAFGTGIVLPYVWTSGSPLPPRTIRQYPRAYGWEGVDGSQAGSVRMLSFVSNEFAYLGLPAFGEPKCTQEGNGCIPYSVNTKTAPAQVQIGTNIIAAVHSTTFYTDGLVPPDPQSGELYGHYVFHQTLQFPDRETRLRGTYRYASHDRQAGLTYEKVSFDDDGSCRLAYAVDGGPKTRLSGRFHLGRSGRITFWSRSGHVRQRGTVLKVVASQPRRYPYPRGIWLILSGKRAAHPDGNFLELVS